MGFQFICYSHVDGTAYAERLEAALASCETPVSTWRDGPQLIAGTGSWPGTVAAALRDCDGLLFLMTPDSVRPESECWPEWNEVAVHLMKPVILLQMTPNANFYRVRLDQQLVYRGDFEKFVDQVRDSLQHAYSPQGILSLSFRQLESARRRLSNEQDSQAQMELQEGIQVLQSRIDQQQQAITSPTAARMRIAAALTSERNNKACQPKFGSAKVGGPICINSPPLEPPKEIRGRVDEQIKLRNWLADPACRLITVHGRTGGGKTALTCHLIRGLMTGLSGLTTQPWDVIYFGLNTRAITFSNLYTDLCRLVNPAELRQLKDLFEDSNVTAEVKARTLLDALTGRQVVILLDDFDAVLNSKTYLIGDPEVRSVLEAMLRHPQSRLKVILTCGVIPQELMPIHFDRQKLMEISLGLNCEQSTSLLRDLDADGQLGLLHVQLEFMQQVWRRTAGNPRALVHFAGLLAASPQDTPQELLDNLPVDLTQALVGELYAALDPVSQITMGAISCCSTTYFPRVSAAAIDFILQPFFPGFNGQPLLAKIVRLHLAQRDRWKGTYILDPVDAEYASFRLMEGKQNQCVVDVSTPITSSSLISRSIAYYEQLYKSSDAWSCKEDLHPQLAVIELLLKLGDFDRASELLADIDLGNLVKWGHYSLVIQLRQSMECRLTQTRIKRYSAAVLGICYWNQGQVALSIVQHEAALLLAREGNNEEAEAVELGCLAVCYRDVGQAEKGFDLLSSPIVLNPKRADSIRGIVLANMGICQMDLGHFELAAKRFAEAIEFGMKDQDEPRRANRQANLALALLECNHPEGALAAAAEAVALAAECDQPYFRVEAFRSMALVQLTAGKLAEARVAIEEALRDDTHLTNQIVLCLAGMIGLCEGRKDAAEDAFNRAVERGKVMVSREPRLFVAHDATGFAYSGLALLNQGQFVQKAHEAFHRARRLTSAPGVVAQVCRLFEPMIALDINRILEKVRSTAITRQ